VPSTPPTSFAKIGDLGVAKLLETSTAFAQTIVGTPYYLSPELCADKPYRDKSDCWALGVLLYECCTLHHPFEARNQCALIMKIMGSKVEPPDPKLVSSELSALCLWLLNKDPEKRPTIKEILNQSVVRAELEKHELPLPYELHDVEPSHKLERLAASVASPDETTRGKSSSSSSSGAGSTSASTSTATSSPSAASSSRANNSSAVPPARLPERGGGGNSGVMGNRVRGGGARAQRQPSKTAMERYQVKQTPLEQHVQATRQQEQMHRISGQLNGEDKLEGGDQHMRTHMESSSKGVDVGLDGPMNVDVGALSPFLAEAKGVGVGAGNSAADDKSGGAVPTAAAAATEAKTGAVPSSGDDADYDVDDFEEYESDFETDVSGGEAAAAAGDRDVEEADADADLGELGGDETQVKLLESLVREAREKSLASLGPELFEKVYALCSEHMGGEINEEGAAVGDGGSTVSGSSFVAELEEALCQQLKGGVDVACEAVFGVKVLLALESKVSYIERKQEGDALSGSHK